MKKDVIRLNVNVPASLIEKLDTYGKEMNINRTAALAVALSTFFREQEALKTFNVLAQTTKQS